jgi:hypothetical protein
VRAELEDLPFGDFLYPKPEKLWRYINPTFPPGSLYTDPQNSGQQGKSSLFDDAYTDCASKLGNAPDPGLVPAASVIQMSQKGTSNALKTIWSRRVIFLPADFKF